MNIELKLIEMAAQIYLNSPVLTARGFFGLDYKWFLFIVNFTTSYSVILLRYIDSNITV